MSQLPSGFVIDGAPAIPDGFVLDGGPSVAADVAKSAGVGVAHGVIGAAGLPADVTTLGRSGLGWLADQTVGRAVNRLRTGQWDATTGGREAAAAINQPLQAQTSAGLTRSVESVTGPMYEPQTTAGSYARTIGRNIPAASMGPGGPVARGMMAVVPGVAEEAAGQATAGSAVEPYARAGAGILAGAGTLGGIRAAQRAAARQTVMTEAPTRDQLRAASNAAYTAADNAGVRFSQPSVQQAVVSTGRDLLQEGIDPVLNPRATQAFRRLAERAGGDPTLREMENARRIANNAAMTMDPSDARLAGRVVDSIDNYMMSAGPADVVSGNPQAAARLLGEARGNWGAMRRSEMLDQAIERARMNAESAGAGANIDNTTRQAFKSIARDPKKMRGFSEDERLAIRQAVGGTAGQNILRGLGKFAPSGLVSAVGGGGAGYALGGPAGAAAVMSGGTAAKSLADAITRRNAEYASALVRARSPAASPELQQFLASNPLSQIETNARIRALLLASDIPAMNAVPQPRQ